MCWLNDDIQAIVHNKIGDSYDPELCKSERTADSAAEPKARTGRPTRRPAEARSADPAAEPKARTRRSAEVMLFREKNPRLRPGVFICWIARL